MHDRDAPRLCRVAGRDAWHIYHRRRRVSTGTSSRTEAEQALAAYKIGLDRPASHQALSVTEILARYLADRRDASIPGAARLEYAHRPLARFWGERPPEAISAAECRRYTRTRLADGVGAGTARIELQALSAALRWASRAPRRWIPVELPEMALPPRPPARDRWLTPEEAARLLEGCGSFHIRLFCLIALHTGARKGAILGLTWERIDLDRGLIDFRDPEAVQTRKRRVRVPINETLLPELRRAAEGRETDWVIEWAGDRVASIKRAFREACSRAELEGVTPHTLRHTAATWMAQRGVPLWEIAGMLGHTSMKMLMDTYGHHSPDHLRQAAASLG